MKISYEEIRKNPVIKTYIKKADESLIALGYTEHSFAHVGIVSENASRILTSISSVMDYFEIFLNRMILCRKAAEKLRAKFVLRINGQQLLQKKETDVK